MQLSTLNAADQTEFIAQLGAVFEHSPWVAARAWEKRPFADLAALHDAMMAAVYAAPAAEKLALIRAHPELAGREASEGGLTMDSSGEQGRLGFTALSRAEFLRIQELNRQYREKFGFPCIVALLLHATRESVTNEMQRRLGNDRATEIEHALSQIGGITLGRLQKMLGTV
ncbi:MAG: OHCU decarboxylase [Betaproteobacteria bacterium RIFCSPLOWO2_02_FULL_62_17]|nr:MAG: OHCU decarboxylase [Betaproteobacteria bacterium RIFCSPLOWO2_02_FULL_62_17]